MFLDLISQKNALLEDLFDDLRSVSFPNSYINPMPTDIIDKKDHYLLIANVPGLTKEDIKISLEKNKLTIETSIPMESEKKEEKQNQEEQEHYLRQERPKAIIKRSFKINSNLTMEDIQGSVLNGLLKIKINKKQDKPEPKQYLELK